MKNILLSTIMLIAVYGTVKAQTDFCKDITKSSTGSKFIYESPTPGDKKEEVGKLGFIKVIDDSGPRIYFKLGLGFSNADLSQNNVTVVFEDDDALTFSNLEITKGPSIALLTETKTLYYTLIPLTKDQLTKFKTKKLKNYTFMGEKRYPGLGNPKVKLMAYANCMDSFTDGPAPVVNANEKKSIDGFWGIKFGASVDEISAAMKAKGAKLHPEVSDANTLVYADVQFTQRDVSQINMKFVEAKFYEAVVKFPAPAESQVLSQFQTITNELVGVYGEGKLTKAFEPPYVDGDGYTVSALQLGKASFFYLWKTNNGNTIQLQINKDLSMFLFYTDKTTEKLKDAKKSSDY